MKKLILIFIGVWFLGCKESPYLKYNVCDFYTDSLKKVKAFSRYVDIDNMQFNEQNKDDSTMFYGIFSGKLNGDNYNFLVFNTHYTAEELKIIVGRNELGFKFFGKIDCFDFNSSIIIDKYTENGYPVLAGRLQRVIKDSDE